MGAIQQASASDPATARIALRRPATATVEKAVDEFISERTRGFVTSVPSGMIGHHRTSGQLEAA
jgi:hypothetical protein